jgi:putative heme-binding domain-containing protein
MLNDQTLPIGNRAAAFWTMARTLIDSKDVDKTPEYVKQLLERPNDPLIAAALHLTSTYQWNDTTPTLVRLLQNSSPTVQRLAAECLGRSGLASSADPLLQSWSDHHSSASSKPDRMVEHSILFALIELGTHRDSSPTIIAKLSELLTSEASLNQKHASLHVLKEMQHLDKVPFAALANAAESKHEALARLAQDSIATIEAHRKQFLSQLSSRPKKSLDANASSIAAVLVAGYNQPDVVEWVRANILDNELEQTWHSDLLRRMLASYENQALPDGWSPGLASLVRKDDPKTQWLIERIAATKISANAKELVSAIAARVDSEDFSKSAAAIAMLPKGLIPVSVSKQRTLVKTMLNANDGNHQLARRSIRKVDLEADAWEEILRSLKMFGPIEFPGMVETLASSRVSRDSERTGRLLAAIEQSPASKSLAADQVERWFAGHAEGTKKEVKLLLDRVFAPPADMKSAMDELAQKLEPGDAHRGQDIYRSSRAACSACHRIGYVGGNIGPELTKIGKSRNRRDFVEAILYPSHRIAQGFASTSILTVDDEVITGLITFEDDSRIELSTSADKKVSVDKKSIQQRNQSAVSLMPSGIDKVLTISELSDLIAFLEQSK